MTAQAGPEKTCRASEPILDKDQVRLGMRSAVGVSLGYQAMFTFTGGAFMVALAVSMGASNFQVGLLAALSPLAQLAQLPAVRLVESWSTRRAISLIFGGLAKLFILMLALSPLMIGGPRGVWVMAMWLGLHAVCVAVYTCAYSSWMRDLLPLRLLGAFNSRRMLRTTALSMFLGLLAAFALDWWRVAKLGPETLGYVGIFTLGVLVSLPELYFLTRIPEPERPHRLQHVTGELLLPLKDPNFHNLLVFLGAWNLAVNLAAPFFTVYMLRRLNLGLSWVIGLVVLSQLMNLASFRLWGRVCDRYSNKSALSISGPLFVVCTLAWTFTTLPEPHALTIPLLVLLHALLGISTAGTLLSTANIALKLAPRGQSTAFLAAAGVVNSLAAGVGPVVGGSLADFFAARELSLTLHWKAPGQDLAVQTLSLQHWDFFFLAAFLIGLYSLRRLRRVQEVGTADSSQVLRMIMGSLRTQIRNFSTVGGLRHLTLLPLQLARRRRRPHCPGQRPIRRHRRPPMHP